MIICAWDVGIKTLAYCLIQKIDEAPYFKILKWNLINISDTVKAFCSCETKAKTICGKSACLYRIDNDVHTNYCKTHSKQYIPLKNGWENEFMKTLEKSQYKEFVCRHITKEVECAKFARFCSEDKHYCLYHSKMIVKNKKKESELIKIKKINVNTIGPDILGKIMCRELDAVPQLYEADKVLIENQPSLINPVMKTISCFLFQSFLIRGVVDKKKDMEIKFIAPSGKLNINDDTTTKILNSINLKDDIYKLIEDLLTKLYNRDAKTIENIKKTLKDSKRKGKEQDYNLFVDAIAKINDIKILVNKDICNLLIKYILNKKTINNMPNEITIPKDDLYSIFKILEKKVIYNITKSLAIKYTELLITPDWLNHLNKHDKKDDLCDAFLHGYYHMFKV